MDWEQTFATGHIVAAVSALLVGAAVLLSPKGTRTHRRIGTVYVVALVLVNVAALSLHRESTFGVFHGLAIASLVTIAVGFVPLLLGKWSPPVIVTHAYCMTIDGKAGGMGVVIGARVGALAGSSDVVVSQTVKNLVAGSGLVFEDAGEHELKGVPERWRIYRVVEG